MKIPAGRPICWGSVPVFGLLLDSNILIEPLQAVKQKECQRRIVYLACRSLPIRVYYANTLARPKSIFIVELTLEIIVPVYEIKYSFGK